MSTVDFNFFPPFFVQFPAFVWICFNKDYEKKSKFLGFLVPDSWQFLLISIFPSIISVLPCSVPFPAFV